MKRGEIYFISIPYSTGHEMQKDRPGIIVSRDSQAPSSTVTVVLCSTSANPDRQYHVTVRSMRKLSVAMCEHVCAVDCSRLGTYLGEASPQEMQAIDIALASSLGLDFGSPSSRTAQPAEPVEEEVVAPTAPADGSATIKAELDVYKMLYNDLLSRMLGGAR